VVRRGTTCDQEDWRIIDQDREIEDGGIVTFLRRARKIA
jgi:hypothetical protein